MAAPQQSSVPTYKETAGIVRPTTAQYGAEMDYRNTPGAALARLLGAVPDAVKAHQASASQDDQQGEYEQEQLMALAKMGAERDRLRIAKGGSFFGLLNSQETTMDAYELERGRRDADIFAGELRDAYAASGLAESDDPKAFGAFVQQYQQQLFEQKLKDSDVGYYHGFVTRVGGVFEEMAKAHAGNLDGFLESKNKRAFQSRLDGKMNLELTVSKERDAFGNFIDNLMGAESGGNYNAFHGNGNNQNIRFTEMTLGEVLDFQSSGSWKRHGAKSSAVGKYQFIEKTLRETVREMGLPLDTKFTPGVQDKLIMHRLMKHRGLKDYLEGKISAEQALDNGLALEFAGLKKTSGRGHYDGDGLNKATLSPRKALAALIAFKEAYIQDPARVKTDEKGTVMLDAEDQAPDDSLSATLDNVEADYGVPQSAARKETADQLIKRMDANPELADREDLEDLMSQWKLPKEDRKRVIEARDRIRRETEQTAQVAEQQQVKQVVSVTDKAIRGDQEAMQELRSTQPQVYQRLLERSTTPPDEAMLDNDGFLEGARYDNAKFPEQALQAYVNGEIDQDTYASAMDEYQVRAVAAPILKIDGVRKPVAMLKRQLPGDALKDTFESQLSTQIADMVEANGGKRPPLVEIVQAAKLIHGELYELHQAEIQRRMSVYGG